MEIEHVYAQNHLNQRAYVYDEDQLEYGKRANCIYNKNNTLKTVYGISVGSFVKWTPLIMHEFKAHPFSKSFLSLYKDGIFEISHSQVNSLYTYSFPNMISISIPSVSHIDELLGFFRKHIEKNPDFGWDLLPDSVFSCKLELLHPISFFRSTLKPTLCL